MKVNEDGDEQDSVERQYVTIFRVVGLSQRRFGMVAGLWQTVGVAQARLPGRAELMVGCLYVEGRSCRPASPHRRPRESPALSGEVGQHLPVQCSMSLVVPCA